MARLYRCDRCGKLIEDKFSLRQPRKFWVGHKVKKVLCRECVDSYHRWWDEGMRKEESNG